MATKRAASAKKTGAKKSAKKKAAAASAVNLTGHFTCIQACIKRYRVCLQSATTPAARKKCTIQFIACIRACAL